MIALLFLSFLWATPICDNQIVINSNYPELQKFIDKKIKDSSHLVAIASEADAVLSKLIANKSPVLLSWLEKRDLISAKEEEIANQWREYYFENFVLNQYPTNNTKINRSVENLFEQISTRAFDSAFKTKLENILKDVKKQAKDLVLSWVLEIKDKQKIIHKIDTVQLYWFDKIEGSPFEKAPLEFLRWGLAYDPPQNRINVGVEAKSYSSDANYFAVIAHEIGHSIDPCRWSFYFQSPNPFTKLISCLRSDKGAQAKERNDDKMNWAIENHKLTQEMADSLKEHPTCNRSFYPPEGTQKDQILETFADWFSAEVFAKSTYNNQFPRPDLCENKKLSSGSSYLTNTDRLMKVYLSHPNILKKLKPKPNHYCQLN